MKSILTNKIFWIAVAVIVIVLSIYFYGRTTAAAKYKKPKKTDLPNGGSGIPTDENGKSWDPLPTAISIHDCISGWGTDEDKFFNTIAPLTDDQVAAVYNAYNSKYYPDGATSLIDDIQGDFSGSELTNALSYFKNISL